MANVKIPREKVAIVLIEPQNIRNRGCREITSVQYIVY